MTTYAPSGWSFLNGIVSPNLKYELQREICQGHPLYGKELTAIMRRKPFDDVLFLVEGADLPYYLVRLTWGYEDNPNLPFIIKFKNYEDFTRNWEKLTFGIAADHEEWRFFYGSV